MEAFRSFDLSLFRSINVDLHRDWLDPYFTVLSYSGLGICQALMCLALLAYRPTRSLAWPLGFASALAGFGFADGLKKLLERERPSNYSWALIQEQNFYHSFPSGHTASSFGFAAMLLFLLYRSDYRWVGWVAIVWAFLVGVSRMYRGIHFPSDVIGGMLCGFTGAAIVYAIYDQQGKLPVFHHDELDDETEPG